MKTELKAEIVHICDEKMAKKGNNVGLSFYAFFANKMEAAHWWIMEHRLDHFEKASKIKALVLAESD
ncbi:MULTISPECIES: DUF6500 family protein [Acinetobacter]|uniref:Uncharacterized protein n=1 Tax=Acinetobacter higginsii TaxID=70347 RepID=N9SXM7_9GAMM|nr:MULTISPECIES: DUF6500 family protein [Acinetobacter]ENX56042.1 hypothetical protein F902_03137 [Acinetobacter higginsii]